ncbi:hypothetical protein V8G54_035571, partial [Vigna mungo]
MAFQTHSAQTFPNLGSNILAQYPILVRLHPDYSKHSSVILRLPIKALPLQRINSIHSTNTHTRVDRENGPDSGKISGGGVSSGLRQRRQLQLPETLNLGKLRFGNRGNLEKMRKGLVL